MVKDIYAIVMTVTAILLVLTVISFSSQMTTVKRNYADMVDRWDERYVKLANYTDEVEAENIGLFEANDLMESKLTVTQSLMAEGVRIIEMLENELRWAIAKKNQALDDLRDANKKLDEITSGD